MKVREIIRLLFAYPGKIFKWIVEGRFHNLTLITLAVTILYFLSIITYKPKIVSALLLVSGLSIIIWQMIGDSKRFPNRNLNTLKNWIKKFPGFKSKNLKINVGSANIIMTAGKAHVRIGISKDASVEEKVNYLIQQKEEMETAIINLDDKLDSELSELNKNIKELDKKIIETENIINSTISEVTVGNYDLKLFSVVLMICGTFLQILI
jgi:hypothetical protein